LPNHLKVIPFPKIPDGRAGDIKWKFFDYGTEIDAWYKGLSEGEQDTLQSLLKTNGKAETTQGWTGCKMLQGEGKEEKVWEWRFNSDRVQQRLLGIFGDKRQEAIFLIGCNHKQGIYKPRDCIKTAAKRARQVRERMVTLNARKIRTDI
jgi:hypothetical protein